MTRVLSAIDLKKWEEVVYLASGIVEDVKGNDAEEVGGDHKRDREEKVALLDREILFGRDGYHFALLNDFNFQLLFSFHCCRAYFWRLWTPASDPERDGHDSEIDGYQHGAG